MLQGKKGFQPTIYHVRVYYTVHRQKLFQSKKNTEQVTSRSWLYMYNDLHTNIGNFDKNSIRVSYMYRTCTAEPEQHRLLYKTCI